MESPSRGSDWTAQEVYVGNSSLNPVPVDPTTRGENKTFFNEVSIAALATVDVVSLTVPVGKGIDMKVAECSGENLATYKIKIDGNTKSVKRSWWTRFNVDFFLTELNAQAGSTVTIEVENKSNSTAFFNATLYYNEYDL